MQTTKVEDIPEDLKAEMLKQSHFDQATIVEHYNDVSENYEKIYLTAGYHDPKKSAELTKEVIGDNATTAVVLDMGCGTGLVGQFLKEFGFQTIDGIDASAGMLEQARKKESYRELHDMFLGKPETFPEHFHNKYDAITAVGILAEGHLDCSVFDEMLLALKQGGYAVFTTRTMYLTKYGYGDKLKELEEQGKWKLVKEIAFDRYDQLEEAIGRFQKVEVRAYAYQKL